MPIFQLITVALGMSFFVVSLVMLYRVRQLTVIRGLQGWWAFLGLLVLFFMAGYAAFFVFLLQGTAPSFDINLMISLIFFGGSVFVFACSWLFLSTLRYSKHTDQQLGEAMTRLRHAEKLEAVGRLAGNVAHDFNNILTAIIGHADLGSRATDRGSPEAENFTEISAAGRRAEKLTSQLLSFSRKKPTRKQTISLAALLDSSESLFRQALRADVRFSIITETPGWINGDADQIRLLIINLINNANDAVDHEGSVSVVVQKSDSKIVNRLLQETGHEASAPEYVSLSVIDDGTGINDEDQRHIFDPYFTTKDASKGTGLGLSIAYGIARQHEGVLELDSKAGEGSTFTLYLPVTEEPRPEAKEALTSIHPDPRQQQTNKVLIIDDDLQVLQLTSLVLKQAGFEVRAVKSAEEALAAIEEQGMRFRLILCDVLLPRMNGPELVQRIKSDYPDILVLHMSGYPGDSSKILDQALTDKKLIMKPFSPQELLAAINELQ